MIGKIASTGYFASYTSIPKPIWVLSAGAFINSFHQVAFIFLTLYLTQGRGFHLDETGFVLFGLGFGAVFGSYVGGRLIDRFGARTLLLASLGGSTPALALAPFMTSATGVAACMAIAAVAQSAFRPAYNATIIDVASEEDRSRSYSLYLVMVNLGVAIAATVAGHLILIDYTLVFLVACMGPLAGLAYLSVATKRLGVRGARDGRPDAGPADAGRAPAARMRPHRDKAFLLVCAGTLTLAMISTQIRAISPLYLDAAYGFGAQRFALLQTASSSLLVLLSVPVTSWIKRFDKRWPLLYAGLALSTGVGGLPFGTALTGPAQEAFVWLSMIVWTSGSIILWPVVTSIAMDRAGATGARGEYLGVYNSLHSISSLIAPALGAVAYGRLGGDVIWSACLAGGWASTLLLAFAAGRKP